MDNLTDKERARLEKLEKQKQKQLDRQKNYFAANYDRIAFVLPKGTRDKIRDYYSPRGLESLADIFKYLLEKDGFKIDDDGAGAGSATIPDYIPTKTKLVNYSAEVLAPGADDDIQPQAEKTPAQAATNSALESRLDRLLNDHT